MHSVPAVSANEVCLKMEELNMILCLPQSDNNGELSGTMQVYSVVDKNETRIINGEIEQAILNNEDRWCYERLTSDHALITGHCEYSLAQNNCNHHCNIRPDIVLQTVYLINPGINNNIININNFYYS